MPYPETVDIAFEYASNFITGDSKDERLRLLPKIKHTVENFVLIGSVKKDRAWVQGSINAVGTLNRLIYEYDKIAERGEFGSVEQDFRTDYTRTLDETYIYHEWSDDCVADYLDRQCSMFYIESEAIRTGHFSRDVSHNKHIYHLFDVQNLYIDNAVYGFLFSNDSASRENFAAMAKLLDIYDCLVDFEDDAATMEVCPFIMYHCFKYDVPYQELLKHRASSAFLREVAATASTVIDAHENRYLDIRKELSEVERASFDRVRLLTKLAVAHAYKVAG